MNNTSIFRAIMRSGYEILGAMCALIGASVFIFDSAIKSSQSAVAFFFIMFFIGIFIATVGKIIFKEVPEKRRKL